MEGIKHWNKMFNWLKDNCQSKILCPVKISLKNQGELKTFSHTKKYWQYSSLTKLYWKKYYRKLQKVPQTEEMSFQMEADNSGKMKTSMSKVYFNRKGIEREWIELKFLLNFCIVQEIRETLISQWCILKSVRWPLKNNKISIYAKRREYTIIKKISTIKNETKTKKD